MFLRSVPMILSFFASRGWESWDLELRPLLPERMPVLVDDDLRLEDGPGAPRPAAAVNRWLRGLPTSGARHRERGRSTRGWCGSGWSSCAGYGVGVFGARERAESRCSASTPATGRTGPEQARFAAATWNQHMSVLSPFYRWAIEEGHAGRCRSLTGRHGPCTGTGREARVNLARRRSQAARDDQVPGAGLRGAVHRAWGGSARTARPIAATGGGSWPATRRSGSSRWPPGCAGRSSLTCWSYEVPALPPRRTCRSRSRCRRG